MQSFETKEAFSDMLEGTESWYSIIQEFVETEISDEAMAEAALVHCAPRTKEEFYYRSYFESYYPGRAPVILIFTKNGVEMDRSVRSCPHRCVPTQ